VTLTLDSFLPLIGTSFQAGGAGAFTLIEAQSLASAATRAETSRRTRQPFSLVFAGPATPTLPQATRQLDHPTLGSLDIFLVPIGAGKYEAVFT
jgi:hypothetical protein